MEQLIQNIDRYFQHAKRTKLNTFTSASVMSSNASKAISALKDLCNDPEHVQHTPILEDIITGLSKAPEIYEKYCGSLNAKLKGDDQLFINLNHTLYNNLGHFLQVFYHVE